jgi:hypothetical protein
LNPKRETRNLCVAASLLQEQAYLESDIQKAHDIQQEYSEIARKYGVLGWYLGIRRSAFEL